MSNASKYRKKAVEYEQLKQFDRAVASYVRAIEENENASEDVDVALFNKVGDLTLRQGRVTEAVTYYERAVEHYVSNNLYDNAIALCNKILRNAPGRSNVYFSLGRICGRKGLRSDATRNFLEYATRMQQEGRVDEGMRALAEVADLMPELTEVRRLVEEHAARAGISLTRKRDTPVRVVAQEESEAVRAFGRSKDLVFLQVDYDAIKPLRGKTPPPQRSVSDVADEIAAPVASVPAAAAPTVAAPVATPIAQPATTRLEDLMIFDPRVNVDAPDEIVDATVVDGASILKPYVDPETPVISLEDLEPTGLSANMQETVVADDPISDILQRGVAPRAPGDVDDDEPVVVVRVPTQSNFPAITLDENVVALDGVESGITATMFSEVPAELPAISDSHDTFEAPIEHVVAAVEANATVEAEIVETHVGGELTDEFVAESAPFIAGEEFATTVDAAILDESDIAEQLSDVRALGTIEQDYDPTVVVDNLDGFTADETSLTASDVALAEPISELESSEFETSIEVHAEADVLPSLDFDAMLDQSNAELSNTDMSNTALSMLDIPTVESAEAEIELITDLEVEDFVTSSDAPAFALELPADESTTELVDEFESEYELPPLIFPLPSDTVSAFETIDLDAPVADPFEIVDEIAFDDTLGSVPELVDLGFDIEPLDLSVEPLDLNVEPIELGVEPIDLGEIAPLNTGEFRLPELLDVADANAFVLPVNEESSDSKAGELVFLDVSANDAPLLTPMELHAVAPEPVADDLDDLFGVTGVHTAVVAAEATIVASSRCAELQSASDADPNNFVLRRRLAEALFESGKRDEAISELCAALAGAELQNLLSDAAEIADELVRVNGDDVAHHQKRLELAIRLGDQARLRDAYLDLADTLVRRGEDLRAKAVYARVLEIDPDDDRARTALGDSAPPPPARPAAAASDEGHVNLADWLRDDDEPTSTRLRMREPDVTGDEQDDFNALLKHFKEGVSRSLGEDDYESHYDLGVAYKEMGLLDDAIGEFQMALRSRNNRLAAYEALGQCFLEQESYKVAVTVLSRALHEPAIQDEQRVGILYLLGYSCEVLQRFDEARGYFQRVYATDIHFRDVAQRLADLERTVR